MVSKPLYSGRRRAVLRRRGRMIKARKEQAGRRSRGVRAAAAQEAWGDAGDDRGRAPRQA